MLSQCRRPRDIQNALRQLPATLDQTYERILESIDPKDDLEVFAILYWLTSSKRPLSLRELAEAAIIQPSDQSFDPEARLRDPSEILHICGSLVTYSPSSNAVDTDIVRFAHYTVQEFLLSGRANRFSITIASCQNHIMGSCVLYLQYLKSVQDPQPDQYPLLQYAAQFWFEHKEANEEMDPLVMSLIHELFSKDFSLHAQKWLGFYEPCTSVKTSRRDDEVGWSYWSIVQHPGPLYYAVHHKLYHTAMRLLEAGASPNELHVVELDLDSSPVLYPQYFSLEREGSRTLTRRMTALAKPVILTSGVMKKNLAQRQTALHLAVQESNLPMVALLLRFAANPNICATAAPLPSLAKHMLGALEKFKRHRRPERRMPSPLGDAVRSGHTEMVKLLLDHGARPDVGTEGLYSLVHAIQFGRQEVVSQLLQAGGVNINSAPHPKIPLPLAIAAAKGDRDICQLLLDAGAHVNAFSDHLGKAKLNQSYALLAGAAGGYGEIVQLLLSRGANTHPPTPQHRHAITAAAVRGFDEVVQILIKAGADPNAEGCVQRAARWQR